MKELSIEEKAKRYDKAIERARKILKRGYYISGDIESMFSELKESEDEKIRKALISRYQGNGCLCNSKYRLSYKKIVDWLENQGEIDKVSYEIAEKEKREFVGDGFIKCYADFQDFKEEELYWLEYVGNDNYNVRSDNLLGKTYHITPCQLYTIFKKMTWLEKPSDKVKPKFKVGDWVVFNGLTLYVKEVVKGFYRTISIDGIPNSYDWNIDNAARLWTIQDAKPGDVLATDAGGVFIYAKVLYNMPYAYCGVDKFGVFKDNCLNNNWTNSVDCVHPATKEQRQQLEKAMTDARYTFDFDKKELNRIMDEKQIKKNLQDNSFRRMFEQKPAWSEEDKVMLDEIIDFFENGTVKLQHDLSLYASWLKSLRPQNTWKPSDEQMEALEHFIVYHNGSTNYAKDLEELRLQLKKL